MTKKMELFCIRSRQKMKSTWNSKLFQFSLLFWKWRTWQIRNFLTLNAWVEFPMMLWKIMPGLNICLMRCSNSDDSSSLKHKPRVFDSQMLECVCLWAGRFYNNRRPRLFVTPRNSAFTSWNELQLWAEIWIVILNQRVPWSEDVLVVRWLTDKLQVAHFSYWKRCYYRSY